METAQIPLEIIDVLKTTSIGYLTTISKKGDLYSYPVAFYYSDFRVYFVTPASAAKYKMIRDNPTVSLIVDNKQVTTKACGAMIQGKARTFSVTRTIISILSLGPKVAGFSKKYPGMLTFYAKGKGLPDERKLYKYRIIQIEPTKILYWIGYNFGRYLPEKKRTLSTKMGLSRKEHDVAGLSQLFQSAEEEPTQSQGPLDHDWLAKLGDAVSAGHLSEEERTIISKFKTMGSPSQAKLAVQEKNLVRKWREKS